MWQRRAFLRAAGAGFAASLLPRQAEALERSDLVFASSIQRCTRFSLGSSATRFRASFISAIRAARLAAFRRRSAFTVSTPAAESSSE